MSRLAVKLPLNDGRKSAGSPVLRWLLPHIQRENPDGLVSLRLQSSGSIEIGPEDGPMLRLPLSVDGALNAAENVEIAAGLRLRPPSASRLIAFLKAHPVTLDHIGLNLSQRDIGEAVWRQLIATLCARFPVHRLELGSPNDILLIIGPDPTPGVLELVHDRSAAQSSLHLCLRIAAPRDRLEAEFPDPFGGYKPGDEPFFRSVALAPDLTMPAYIDFAFEDADMTPWPQIVDAIGKRIC